MKHYRTWVTTGLAALLLLNVGLPFAALAAPREVRREIREGAREIRQERREAIREIRRANGPREVRQEIREGRREVRQERREMRREVRREIRQDVRQNRWDNRWVNRATRWQIYRDVRQDIRDARTVRFFLGILGGVVGIAIAQSNSGATNDVQLDEAIQKFGYISGAAFQCAGRSAAYEQDAVNIFNRIYQLFGENRAGLYETSFAFGSTDSIDRTQCGNYVRQFRDAIQQGVLNR